jgi:hypothetical protein
MAQGKEPFLARWSRLKQEKPEEKKPLGPPPELPALESLAPESEEFKSFMHPQVKDALRRAALKKLFNDPHFNIPDPFEPFSGDWTGGDPIPPELLATLNQAKEVLFREEEEEKKRLAEEKTKTEPDEPGRQDT